MNNKKILIILSVMSVLLLLAACGKSNVGGELLFPSSDDVAAGIDVTMPAYKDTVALATEADTVVVGTIVSDGRVAANGSVDYAISTLEVERVIKGDVAVGDVLNIQEAGEITEDGDVSIGGAPLLKAKMRVLLYLNEPTTVILKGETSYGITGAYYGKFYYDQEQVLHPASALAAEVIEPLEDFKEPIAEKQALNAIEKSVALAK